MFTCTKIYRDIPFAHRQWKHDGHCSQIHGHNWEFVITFGANERDSNGFVLDFGKMEWAKAVINHFDHSLVLCKDDPFLDTLQRLRLAQIIVVEDASSEGLAKYVFERLSKSVNTAESGRVKVVEVVVREDSRNSVCYCPR